MKAQTVNFTYHLGDNTLEVEATVTPVVGAVRYSGGGGQPAEGGEVEILEVRLLDLDSNKSVPFNPDGIFTRRWGRAQFYDLYKELEEAAGEAAAEGEAA